MQLTGQGIGRSDLRCCSIYRGRTFWTPITDLPSIALLRLDTGLIRPHTYSVEGLMESMRYSVASDNIKVALVNPGPVATQFIERYKREQEDARVQSTGKPGLAARMSQRAAHNLEGRLAGGQTRESCAQSIVDVIEREYPKRVDGSENSVRFWNGTTESADEVIAAVKCDPSGCEGPIYRKTWKTAADLADSVRGAGED
jgi:hypothetical protein